MKLRLSGEKAFEPMNECFLLSGFALPHYEHFPAKLFQLGGIFKVTLPVSLQLRTPIVRPGLRQVIFFAPLVGMPEATMHKNDLP